ncbi:HAD-IA family hydrolase [Actinobacillus seminis]|uniref:HAD-IA family hydrolase n=1 Tax=Actinobacillus seminis TaxID=722 RepID=UPI003B9411B9
MKFYRSLQPFRAISFDLDDTLYDNREIIRQAEWYFIDYVKKRGKIAEFNQEYWQSWRNCMAQQFPHLTHDVTAWRAETLTALLQFQQKSTVEITQICQQAMAIFFEWRNKIQLPRETVEILTALKPYYPLIAITNGNVDPKRIGLHYFDHYFRAGEAYPNGHFRAKPHPDMFHHCATTLNITPQDILHVGDNLITDVQGALQAGCQSVWINLSGETIATFSEARLLPTVEINELSQLVAVTQQ